MQSQYQQIQDDLDQLQSTDTAHQREIQELNSELEEARACSRCVLKASSEIIDAFFLLEIW